MVRKRDSGPAHAGRVTAIQVHKRRARQSPSRARPPAGLVARPTVPKSKHKTILEWTENADKKKKLEIELTTNAKPNANFSFVPIGHPELTSLCKELSREQGALVYIVSTTHEKRVALSDHVQRIGYHFRTRIVEQATSMIGGMAIPDLDSTSIAHSHSGNKPEPIPENQEEINKQADAAIRDLFPRIPNTDREMIIRHAFQKGAVFNGKPVVGLQEDLTLSRRVQLAVVAHIRHTHTRYDLLLRETSWENARKTVESLCLDVLVKWRGDEETGRDQLDEVLREIVVLDDSDEDDDSDSDELEGEEEEEEEEDGSYKPITDVALAINDTVTFPEIGTGVTSMQTANAVPITKQRATEPQSGQRARAAQEISDEEIATSVNVPGETPGIASRTRSKTRPQGRIGPVKLNPRRKAKKAHRGRKRQQAWQDALNRRSEKFLTPKTPHNQGFGGSVQEVNSSPNFSSNHDSLAQISSNLHAAPPDVEYQSIYAMDNTRGPGRLRTRLASPQHMAQLSELPIREEFIVLPRDDNHNGFERNLGHGSRSVTSKVISPNRARFQPNYAHARRDVITEDMALPSIEPAVELANESPSRVDSCGPTRNSQVRYPESEPKWRLAPSRPNVTYVNGWDDHQPKRRRMVLDNEAKQIPVSMSDSNSYVRIIHGSGAEQSSMTAPSFRSVAETGDIRDRSGMILMSDQRVDYPAYAQRVSDSGDRNFMSSRTDSSAYICNERERERCIIIDDTAPPLMRVLKRAYGPNDTYSTDRHVSEPQYYESHRVEDQRYPEVRRSPIPIRSSPQEDIRPVDAHQYGRPIFFTRAPPGHQQRVAADSSSSPSNFHSHAHTREMNSGLVSYPSLSRSHHEHESRFSSSRNEPIMVGAHLSHQLATERFAGDQHEIVRQHSREDYHRPPKFGEVSRLESRYAPIDSHARMQQIEPHYIPVGPQGRVHKVVRSVPTVTSRTNEPATRRSLPYMEEVIVLSD